jgi:hypothetical protein
MSWPVLPLAYPDGWAVVCGPCGRETGTRHASARLAVDAAVFTAGWHPRHGCPHCEFLASPPAGGLWLRLQKWARVLAGPAPCRPALPGQFAGQAWDRAGEDWYERDRQVWP